MPPAAPGLLEMFFCGKETRPVKPWRATSNSAAAAF